MELTAKQEIGLKIAVSRYKSREAYTCIAGYAGTGKSTLIQFIVSALGLSKNEVCYVAYTGKAAQVLRSKGCENAVTAHKLLAIAKPMPNGTFKFEEKSLRHESIVKYKLIVVDEISMLPKSLWDSLVRHGVHVIACGDPEQLPPIYTSEDNHILDHPHVFLDEIMRQAYDSEIIRLSMYIREGKPLSLYQQDREQVQIFNKFEVTGGMYGWADQILCATNTKRNEINSLVRIQRGYGEAPNNNDKIISLSNHWDVVSSEGQPLTNGLIGNIDHYYKNTCFLPKYISNRPLDIMWASVATKENDKFNLIPIDYKGLITGEPTLTGEQIFRIKSLKKIPIPLEFAYAYAITTHRSQGSEWDKVLVFEENFPNSRDEHRRWLYTAITRASEKLVIIKK